MTIGLTSLSRHRTAWRLLTIAADVPIANWGADPAVLVVGRESPLDSVTAFIQHAKQHPGEITVSGAGWYVGHRDVRAPGGSIGRA